jgi:uncharacterized protein
MNIAYEPYALTSQRLDDHIAAATALIAPTWPLDQFIAVNPYWGWVGTPAPEAASRLGVLAGTRLTMPRQWFGKQWTEGIFTRSHLEAAVQAGGMDDALVNEIISSLENATPAVPRIALVSDLRDAVDHPRRGQSWSSLITHQISQHCAAFFDRHQATWEIDTTAGLYGSWLDHLAADHGIPWCQGRSALKRRLAALPDTPQSLIADALDALAIDEEGRQPYLAAVLMAISGWAAWCAYARWQARLAGGDDDQIVHLLAIRLAWEWLLHDDAPAGALPNHWAARWRSCDAAAAALQSEQRIDWLLQHAMELSYQQPLIAGLREVKPLAVVEAPAVQAVFCIDVRSEVFRRALESSSPAVQTCGFAGFFGLPIAYSPLGSALTRPQLPGLLQPAQSVTESAGTGKDSAALGQVLAQRRRGALQWRQRWAEFRTAPASAFSFVESMGLLYAGKLVADSLPSAGAPDRWEDAGLPAKANTTLRPRLPHANDPAAAAAMAKGILSAMGLVRDFAPLVLLTGHGSQSANNPHAAGLDCGACGGQTGEVNARVLADLLNDPAVREHLRYLGIDLPAGTHFLPALHNTTTDQVVLYDTADVPDALQPNVEQLCGWLDHAGQQARAERAASLGLGPVVDQPVALKRAVLERANDWAQVRPEWGLVDNAAFIVAPRRRSQHLNLAGRSFLHDYDWRLDTDLSVLTLIMTAPMVVTHWINMQYHASTVDNLRYGSGNKVLHNVVGGHIGVFEGNGGDLRIGLPMQSLHDGEKLRHTPLRLSVFIEAPRSSVDKVMQQHELVRQLVSNGWLHLFRIEPEGEHVEVHRQGVWVTAWKEFPGSPSVRIAPPAAQASSGSLTPHHLGRFDT